MSYKYTHGKKQVTWPKNLLVVVSMTILLAGILKVGYIYAIPHKQTQKSAHAMAINTLSTTPKTSANYAIPIRLQIPKLQIDSLVKYVGITKEGNMNMPQTVSDVGWYKYGALPGNQGTAVIGGHVSGLHGQPGVFSNLTKLTKGDIIIATESNGVAINFVVRETRNYPEDAQPDEVFHSATGSHLNLITCTGNWDSSGRSFTQRLVVFADKVL